MNGPFVFYHEQRSEYNMKKHILILVVGIAWAGCDFSITPGPVFDTQPQDRTPAWSPDGQWIAYFHFSPEIDSTQYPTGLYLTDVSGQQRKRILSGFAFNPDWSPDGGKIVFDQGDILVVGINGENLTQLTIGGGHYFPSWSPDGSKIAYDIAINDSAGIWIMNQDGANKKRLWAGRNPDWSVDGRYLVYEDTGGIRSRELDGPNSFLLAKSETGYRDPTWSPDGRRIAWVIERGGIGEIWTMSSDGSNQRKLVDGLDPSWSPDSQKLVFSRGVSLGKMVLWMIDLDGTNLKQLTN